MGLRRQETKPHASERSACHGRNATGHQTTDNPPLQVVTAKLSESVINGFSILWKIVHAAFLFCTKKCRCAHLAYPASARKLKNTEVLKMSQCRRWGNKCGWHVCWPPCFLDVDWCYSEWILSNVPGIPVMHVVFWLLKACNRLIFACELGCYRGRGWTRCKRKFESSKHRFWAFLGLVPLNFLNLVKLHCHLKVFDQCTYTYTQSNQLESWLQDLSPDIYRTSRLDSSTQRTNL